MAAPMPHHETLAQWDQNALRLVEAAVLADAQRWGSDADRTPAQDNTAPEPMLDLAALDFDALEGQEAHGEAPQAPTAAALAGALAQLPPELPPLTEPLDDTALAAWLALYRRGDARVVEAVTVVRQWALSAQADALAAEAAAAHPAAGTPG